jgi:hypothetical protein
MRTNGAQRKENAPRAYLIRITDREARLRALEAFGEIPVPYHGFTDYQMLVTREHVEALRREAIPFEVLS